MNTLKEEIINIIRFATFNPDNTLELIGLAVVAMIVGGLTLHHVSVTMGSIMSDRKRTVIILLATSIPVILLTAVMNIYCVPKIANASIAKWLPPLMAGILSLGIAVPSCRFLNRIKYSSSTFAVLLAVVAIWGAALIGSAAIGAVKATCKQFSLSSERQAERQEEIKKAIPR